MKQIPMLDLRLEYEYIKKDIDAAIKKCLEHQQWISGNEVNILEDKLAEYLGVKYCIGVASGTDALVLSLRALAIKLKRREYFDRGEKIITTPFTFVATGDAILRSGATPVFIDIDPGTYNIDAEKIKEYLKTSPSGVVGIMPVHLFGQACNMDEINDIAKSYNLFIVEDAAQALGGAYKKRKLGSFGLTGAFSFFPSKNLGGFGDGGMIATNDDNVAGLAKRLLKHGGKDKYNAEHIGYNSRLDTIQAAILFAKLNYLDEFNTKRRKISEIYNEELGSVEKLKIPSCATSNTYCVYSQYTIRILNEKRDAVQQGLKEGGISTVVYYPIPLYKMNVFQSRCEVPCELKETEQAVKEVLSLPIGPFFTKEQIVYICDKLKESL